uniref:CSON006641 protein n=1 Tax=Culicoides sonorensis TaxID=179676 RepID=A0A336KLS7_CULSO
MTSVDKIEHVTIFIPKKYFISIEAGLLYGKCVQHADTVKFFIVSNKEHQNLELIGIVDEQYHNNDIRNVVRLGKSSDGKGYKVKEVVFNGINLENLDISSLYLIVYDGFENIDSKFKTGTLSDDQRYDVIYLSTLIDITNSQQETLVKECSIKLRQLFKYYILSIYNLISWMLSPLRPLFKQTAIFRHFSDWIVCVKNYGFDNGKAWTLIFDMSAGILLLAFLLKLGNLGEYLMQFTKLIVNNLHTLLIALKGSPVGLKLNVLLNNFFLDCFIYHVDLWWSFLVVMAPAIQYLSYPLAGLGLLGLSFQLALLSDILTIISLHAHCFYIYAAVLYKIEVIGIKALWRVVLGRRKNVLRNRVESHEYMSRQLFLATMFFAALLFLSPTVLVYYIVFASLRFGIYCITYLLMVIRKKIIVLPVYNFIKWSRGSYACPDCMELKVCDTYPVKSTLSKNHVTVLSIEPKSSTPWGKSLFDVQQEINQNDPISIGKFIKGLIKGEMMGFIQPEQKLRD